MASKKKSNATPNESLQESTETPNESLQESTATPNESLQESTATPNESLQESNATPNESLQESTETPNESLQESTATPNGSLQESTATPKAKTKKPIETDRFEWIKDKSNLFLNVEYQNKLNIIQTGLETNHNASTMVRFLIDYYLQSKVIETASDKIMEEMEEMKRQNKAYVSELESDIKELNQKLHFLERSKEKETITPEPKIKKNVPPPTPENKSFWNSWFNS